MNSLGLPGVNLKAERGKTCGIAGTHMKVTVYGEEETEPSAGCGHSHEHEHGHGHGHDHEHSREHDHEHSHEHAHIHDHTHAHTHAHGHGHHHATPGHIGALIDGLNLPDEVKCHAKAVYDAIAQAEAHAHGCPLGDVHFHEVGALDAVADVTGVCYAMYLLKAQRTLSLRYMWEAERCAARMV